MSLTITLSLAGDTMSMVPRRFGEYIVGRRLGKGGQGKVYVAVREGDPEEEVVALKIIRRDRLDKATLLLLETELEIVYRLDHPNINKFKGSDCRSDVDQEGHYPRIVSELAKGGELFGFLKIGPLPEDVAKFYAIQLLSTMAYCHTNRVAHRDLKPENLMLDDEGSFNLKVIDFGLAKLKSEDAASLMHTAIGTKTYWSPEVHAVRAGTSSGYDGFAMDTWAVGVLIFIFLFGTPPTDGEKYLSCYFLKRIAKGEWDTFWKGHKKFAMNPMCQQLMDDPTLRDFIQSILAFNSDVRLTCAAALEHPFSKGFRPDGDLIINEMHRRKIAVGETIRREARENALRKGRRINGDGGEFEPFSFEVHRAIASIGEDTGAPALKLAPSFTHTGRFNDFYSDRYAGEIFEEVKSAIKRIGGKFVEKGDYVLKVKFQSKLGEIVCFKTQIFFDAASNLHITLIDRTEGSIVSFQKVHQLLLDEIGAILSEPKHTIS